MKNILTALFIFCFAITAKAQGLFGLELQAYPTGFIPGVRFEQSISEKVKLHLRAGLNTFNHRELGVHDDESGLGYGFTLGASSQVKNSKFDLGLRTDLWFNSVDWSDNVGGQEYSGNTKITVLQPTAELTYRIDTKKLSIRPSLAFGLEWNVVTDGEPTGEGPILLLGIILTKGND